MYSYKEAFEECLKYFNNDELAANVFLKKYALKDYNGNLLEKTPDDMHHRIAKELSRVEKNKFKEPYSEEFIYSYLKDFQKIVAQGSPSAGIGNIYSFQSLGNCFVIDNVEDSYGGIFHSDQQIGQLMKRRGGVGLDISNIRPKGLNVKNAAKTTDGIAVFMERYSNTCREVAQGGRRGALLISINVHHPEVLTFITIKRDLKKVTGANISVKLTDDFLKAVENDTEYEQYWPINPKKEKQISIKVKARDIWKEIINSAWSTGEPGVMFWDTMLRESLSNRYGEIDSSFFDKTTNPCGEIVMGKDSCRLMITPLHTFVKYPFTDKAYFDYVEFGKAVEVAQRLMDDLIDLEIESIDRIIEKVNKDPENDEIKKIELDLWESLKDSCIKGRRTGLGVNSLADALASLNIKYGSDESFEIVDEIFKTFAIHSMKSSCLMAKELGPFPIYSKDLDEKYLNPFLERIFEASPEVKELHDKYGRRNISLTTCSPTGSISLLTRSSSGIEPLFTLKPYTRRKKINPDDVDERVDFVDDIGDKWQNYEMFHPYLEKWKEITGKTNLEESPYFGATSEDINWEKSVKIQGIIQKWISHSISKTVNAPKDISKEITEKVYMSAWKEGCKGITFYRDGSRSGVLVLDNNVNSETSKETSLAPKRPKELPCDIYHVNVMKKLDKPRVFQYMVMVGILNDKPYEIFAIENGKYDKKISKGKIIKNSRGHYDLIIDENTIIKDITKDTTENEDSLTRLVSLNLRHGVPIQFIVEQLAKVEGEMLCFAKSISRSLKKYIKDGTKSTENCKECGTKMEYENGCFICKSCGWSKCG